MPTYFTSEKIDQVLHLRFEDALTRNSFSLAAARELKSLLATAGEFKALILSAEGRVFCSGGHLSDYASMSKAEDGIKVNNEIRETLSALEKLPVPTLCAVSGDCFGGGVELISCFDHIIAAPHIVLALWQRKISLSYGWGGGDRLEKRVGAGRLKNLSLLTRAMGAHEALTFGLIDELVSDTKLREHAFAVAAKLSRLPNEPVESLKNFSADRETESFNALWWNETHQSILAPRKRPTS